ncbi:putative protein-lysine deacylase ABHD14B [Daphnia carinata]|uniref:putative protein-lysine deacylase ABHD14B n=1 Tax=Daphnia carinata TaxID=120202 RepID=UPI00257B17C6|nr:putative protein-lysine deacylase ABHD14B [Daphnia carinata]XP_057366344.1 putative protein-lysine deacylase ABHD14B [Daphnia carinata]
MVVLGRTAKIVLGSGALLLVLWVTLLVFSANSIEESSSPSSQPLKDVKKQPHVTKKKKKTQEKEPDTPWRRYNLKELAIPESAKQAAKNIKPVPLPLSVRRIETHSIVVNPPEVKSKLTFVFLHGAAFKSQDWADLGTLGLLGALGYKSIAVDLPGFGKTTTPLDGIRDNYVNKVDYMTTLMKELQLKEKQIVLVSPSMSGNYALPYILTHPEMVAGFVVIAPAASGIVPPSKVKALQVPTILIYGDRDTSLGPTSHRDLKTIPNFQAFVLPKAGHAAYLDQPDTFHSLLYNFVKKIDAHPR